MCSRARYARVAPYTTQMLNGEPTVILRTPAAWTKRAFWYGSYFAMTVSGRIHEPQHSAS